MVRSKSFKINEYIQCKHTIPQKYILGSELNLFAAEFSFHETERENFLFWSSGVLQGIRTASTLLYPIIFVGHYCSTLKFGVIFEEIRCPKY
jgi:hypothetical protein